MESTTATDAVRLPGGTFMKTVDGLAEVVLVAALFGQVGLVMTNVFARFLFDASFLWAEEISHLALAILAFIGGALAYRRDYHSPVAVILNRIPLKVSRIFFIGADVLVLLVSLCLLYFSITFIQSDWIRRTTELNMPYSVFAFPFAASMVLFAIYALERLKKADLRSLIIAACAVAVPVGLIWSTHLGWMPWLMGDPALPVCLAILFGSVFLGLPIAFALTIVSFCYFWLTGTMPLIAVPQRMVGNIGGFILLAIPFFIFAGLIMERGGLSLRLVEFGQALIGHVRGGFHQVAVVSMFLVSGLSGSNSADVAAVGTVMRNMPENKQYSKAEGAAVLAASAVMGSTVPPSIGMLVLGSITQISIAGLFIGGFLPAIAIAICLMILIGAKARRANLPKSKRASVGQMAVAGRRAILPLTMPVILFGGIFAGIATPTEVSSFAVIYEIIIAMFIYRFLTWNGLVRAAVDSALLSGLILYILAAASIFSWALTIGYLPQQLVALLQSFGGHSTVIFMLASIALLIVTGSLLEGLPALNILAPMLVPIAAQLGIDKLHYGMVLLIAMGVGIFAPPTGVGFFIACGIMRTPLEPTARAMIPYLLCIIAGLLIVAFVPEITLFLPRLFGFSD